MSMSNMSSLPDPDGSMMPWLDVSVFDACMQVRSGSDLLQAGEVQPGGGALSSSTGHQPPELSPDVSCWRCEWSFLLELFKKRSYFSADATLARL